jgi:copper homeostasis protein
VFGLLLKDQSVDIQRTKELVTLASPLAVTFHRAFDECKNPLVSLEEIISCGCKRILTSGQRPTAKEGKDLIADLVRKAGNRIIIMPGGGVRANTLPDLITTGATEFHSASLKGSSEILPDREEIRRMKSLLTKHGSI